MQRKHLPIKEAVSGCQSLKTQSEAGKQARAHSFVCKVNETRHRPPYVCLSCLKGRTPISLLVFEEEAGESESILLFLFMLTRIHPYK